MIALLGTRGIPANYGGFETFAEELSVRLVERGHQVTVYCREKPSRSRISGRSIALSSHHPHKYLDTVAHTGLSTADLLARRHDVLLYCNAANAIFTLCPGWRGCPRFERGWPGAASQEMESLRESLVSGFRVARYMVPFVS